MSSIVVSGDTSGAVTLSAPAVAGTVTVTLPSASGTMASLASVTANGVSYVNSSGQPTSGSALVFDGTNLGVGVTPSAWISTHKAYQLQGGGSLYNNGADGYLNLANNFYYDGADWRRVTAAPVSMYLQSSSGHLWGFTGTGAANSVCGFPSAQMSLNTSGGLKTLNTIGVGDATPSTSGAGITFPATQSASSDANTLDDYEEGTWLPVLTGDGGGTAMTYTTQIGKYTKIGNVVIADAYILLSNRGTITGNVIITGLPLPVAPSTYNLAVNWGYYAGLAVAWASVGGWLNAGDTLYLAGQKTSGTGITPMAQADIGNTSRINVSVTYTV
jgi:hypothetical protein